MTEPKERTDYLTPIEMYNLNSACSLINQAFNACPYLVGSSWNDRHYRDVDVRLILDDAAFDAMFTGHLLLWELMCVSIGDYLRQRTDLPIDFQIQRRTEANERHDGPRNPLGLERNYAGGGDGTPAWEQGND